MFHKVFPMFLTNIPKASEVRKLLLQAQCHWIWCIYSHDWTLDTGLKRGYLQWTEA